MILQFKCISKILGFNGVSQNTPITSRQRGFNLFQYNNDQFAHTEIKEYVPSFIGESKQLLGE